MPHAEDSAEGLGPEAEMSDLAQVFQAGPVLQLKRISVGITFAQNIDGGGLHFHGLPFTQRCNQLSRYFQRRPRGYLFEQLLAKRSQLCHYLDIIIGGAVVEGDELVVAKTAYPAHYGHFLVFRCGGKKRFYLHSCVEHDLFLKILCANINTKSRKGWRDKQEMTFLQPKKPLKVS